jgi:hypothetical protein
MYLATLATFVPSVVRRNARKQEAPGKDPKRYLQLCAASSLDSTHAGSDTSGRSREPPV